MPSFTITEIAAPTGYTVYPTAINDAGDVVGALVATPPTSFQRAFFWSRGTMQVLPAPAGAGAMARWEITAGGQVAGWYVPPGGELGGFFPPPASSARPFV